MNAKKYSFAPTFVLGKKLLIIVAHPDDETFLAAGTAHLNAAGGGTTSVVCATCGEAGRACVPSYVTPAKLRAIRRKEMLRVAAYLHIKKLLFLNFPDKHTHEHQKEILKRCLAVARRLRPDFIIGFGPDGISGHTDHVTLSAVAQTVARRMRLPYLAFCLSPAVARRRGAWLVKRRKHGSYKPKVTFGTPNMRVPIPEGVKWKAMSFHKSQLLGGKPFSTVPKYAAEAYMKAEYFYLK